MRQVFKKKKLKDNKYLSILSVFKLFLWSNDCHYGAVWCIGSGTYLYIGSKFELGHNTKNTTS